MAKTEAFVLVEDPVLPTTQNRVVRLEMHGAFDEQVSCRSEGIRHTKIQGEGSRTAGPRIDIENLKKSQRIERLERELRELRGQLDNHDRQRSRKRRSQSHSRLCESSHRFCGRHNKDRREYHNSLRSKSIGRAGRSPLPQKSDDRNHNPIQEQLQQISYSPFSSSIERAWLPTKFTTPNMTAYNGRSDSVCHLNHYRQSMALYNGNDALMCQILPLSLGEVALRWFDKLEHGSICSWRELSKAFTTHFITNTRKPKEMDSLMALTMKPRETLKFGLPQGCRIRQSLTKKPPLSMADLMSRIEQHVRVEEDGEPIFKILPQIKNKPYFIWPPKFGGDPATRESKPYCAYYKEHGHLTENCRTYKGFLEDLVRKGHLRQFVDESKVKLRQEKHNAPKDPIGIIEVIHSHTEAADLRVEAWTTAYMQEVFHLSGEAQPVPKRLRKEVNIVRRTATRYWVLKDGNLYKRSHSGKDPWRTELWARDIGSHTCRRMPPTRGHLPNGGLDLVGPLPKAPGNRRWLIVATNYFTKWVETEPLTHINDSDSKKFVWKNIITRFGILHTLISDNRIQFDSGPFKAFYEEYRIRNHFSTSAYPQANGQAESSNKTILSGIKTTPRVSTGETPFSMTYGIEAVIPLDVGLPIIRSEYFDLVTNRATLAMEVDLLEERRESILIHLATYQNGLCRSYDRRIKSRDLTVGNLVLRKVMGSRKDPTQGKLGPNWEGPYKFASIARVGAFQLMGLNDVPVKRPWNICNLKKFYQ
uniref:Integrase catalytic domain-containing protein n=1 Tax=Fagus sylvatica TaxID=28930 RepID=A0A2N9H969_FAGSY